MIPHMLNKLTEEGASSKREQGETSSNGPEYNVSVFKYHRICQGRLHFLGPES